MLRLRTGYSFGRAVGKLSDCLDRYDNSWGNHFKPITDRANSYGWVKWEKLCKEAKRIPVFGAEIAVSPDIHAKRPIADYWLFYASDGNLEALNSLIALAIQQFRYQPLLTYEQAIKTKDIISIAGHACDFNMIKSYGNPNAFQLSAACSYGHVKKVLYAGGKFVPASQNVYPSKEHRRLYELVCGRNASTQTYPLEVLSRLEWIESIRYVKGIDTEMIDDSIVLGKEILQEASHTKLKQASLPVPEKEKSLLEMCKDGAKRTGTNLNDPVYKARLKKELKLIKEKGFEDYFYIVADVVQYAKGKMVVGPARGSSCGSLVCFLLDITSIDPIPHGLIFERFIDLNRHDLPDIDIDFSDQHRSKVIRYLEKKYGKDHVSQLGTVALYRPRSALRECSKTYMIPEQQVNAVLDSIIHRSSGDARAMESLHDCLHQNTAGKELFRQYPEIITAGMMEGHPRHSSKHASAVIVNVDPINNIAPVDSRNGVVMLDKKDAEDLNLLKIDVLGLTQLSVLENAINLVQKHTDILQGKTIAQYLESLPTDYQPAFQVLCDRRWCGIFQFNGIALQNISKQFTIENFNDVASITALARPGPLASGNAYTWVRRRDGKEPITYPHPSVESIVKDTFGVVVYQEQVMEICRQIGDMSWKDVSMIRRAMSKSYGKEFFDQFGKVWKKGAIEKGFDPKKAEKFWDDTCAYGSWAFNKSHAVAYGMISYWCCYIKSRWPLEFAAATLDFEGSPERQILNLRELAREGIDYEPYNAERSSDRWEIYKGKLIGPLHVIKGIGPKAMKTIMGARARKEDIPAPIQKKLYNARTDIDSLYPVRDFLAKVDMKKRKIVTQPKEIGTLEFKPYDQEVVLVVTIAKINVRDLNEAVNLVKRGGERITDGNHLQLNLQLQDDTDIVYGRIYRFDYKYIGQPIVDRGRTGKAVYAIKGDLKASENFRMVWINQVKYLGDLDHGVCT